MERTLTLLTRRPGWVILAILALTLFFMSRIVDPRSGAVHLRVDPSTRSLLPEGDEASRFLETVQRQFGIRSSLIVALRVDDLFTLENLERVARMSQRLADDPDVEQVVSLATAPNVRGAEGEIRIEPFLDPPPRTGADLDRLREQVMANPVYAGNLVSRDGRATAFVLRLRSMPEQEFIDGRVDQRIAEVAREAAGGGDVWITGPAYTKAATSRLILASLGRILPISFLIMALVGLFAFRSLRGVVVPMTTVVLALIWTLGVVAWLGVPLNLVTTIVPPLLLTIGFAYAIHVVSEHNHALEQPAEERARLGGAAAWALRHVALAVGLTGLTTAVGFASLTVSRFAAVREFGWIAVLGVFFTTLLSLCFAPAALDLLAPHARRAAPAPRSDFVERQLTRLGRFDIRHRTGILVVCALVSLAALLGATRIRVNTDLISNFKPDHPVRVDFEAINAALEGAMPFDVIIDAGENGGLLEPENLVAVEALQDWLAGQPEIGGSTSYVDQLRVLNQAFHDGDPAQLRVPASARLARQLLFFGRNDTLSELLDSHQRIARIQVRSTAADSIDLARLTARVEERLTALRPSLEGRITGETVLLTGAIDAVAQGQIETLTIAFVFIYAILALLFTSLRIGLLALLPNALPVVLYFGVLGLSGISLNTTTGLFACIVLGIAVDDTIHLLTRFSVEARQHRDEREGAVEALRAVGRPVTVTTVALCMGFLALTTSELKGQVEFGALGAFILAIAWLVDMTFTPALCAGMRIVTLWDVLTYDLGTDPQHSIPVLRGLSKAQARIVALMTRIDTIPAGAPVFRAGEIGDELLVIVDGEMAISVKREGRSVELTRARRGDVVGEVALHHRGRRTADVDAVTEVRVLRFDKRNLDRLVTRYPRIGARVFRNLSEILSGHLARLTEQVT